MNLLLCLGYSDALHEEGISYQARRRGVHWAAMALPTFHTMGIFMQLYAPLVSGRYVGLYAPQWPAPPVVPNPQNILETSKATECNGMMVVPSIVEVC